MEEEIKCGRAGRSGEGWKPKSERRLEERKGRKSARERSKTEEEKVRGKTWEEKEKVRGEEEKEPSRSVQFDDRSRHQEKNEDLLRSLFAFSKWTKIFCG